MIIEFLPSKPLIELRCLSSEVERELEKRKEKLIFPIAKAKIIHSKNAIMIEATTGYQELKNWISNRDGLRLLLMKLEIDYWKKMVESEYVIMRKHAYGNEKYIEGYVLLFHPQIKNCFRF